MKLFFNLILFAKRIMFLFVFISLNLHANNIEGGRFITSLLESSYNVMECHIDEESKVISYKTKKGKEYTLYYIWKAFNSDGIITVDQKLLTKLKKLDFVIIGYGQNICNPTYYYFLPTRYLDDTLKINDLKRYLLNRPISNNKFE